MSRRFQESGVFARGLLLACGFVGFAPVARAGDEAVKVLRLPDGAVQPRVVAAGDGSAHLVYLRGPGGASDVYYARLSDATGVPAGVRVNGHDGSAVASGSVRGAQLAVGKNGRVHVVWNGSNSAQPAAPGNGAPLLYARTGDDGRFEPERNLITATVALDGGAALSADADGHVHVAWHALANKGGNEQDRRVYAVASADEGRTFGAEAAVTDGTSGACACCGMAGASVGGTTMVLYRGAARMTDRATYLLTSNDAGGTFRATRVHPMNVGMCIMSTYAVVPLPGGNALAAWETDGRVFVAHVDAATGAVGPAVAMPAGGARQKHPSIGVAPTGKVVVAWAEGTGFNKGGGVAWQVFDVGLKPIGDRQTAPGLPASSFPAVWARGDESFVVLY
jgi:hypothetical protein